MLGLTDRSDTPAKTYKLRSHLIVGWTGVALAAGFAVLFLVVPGPGPAGRAVVTIMSGIFGYSFYRAGVRPRVVVSEEGLITVTNVLEQRRFPAAQVSSVSGRPMLTFHLKSGETIKAWAVQAANAALLSGQESYLDREARRLDEFCRAATPGDHTRST